MRKLVILVVLSLLVLSQVSQVDDVQASAVPISESSYVKITNFSAIYLFSADASDPLLPTEWKGFIPYYAEYYKSTPTIETKVFNFMHPGSPPAEGLYACEQNGILFDCHAGNANIGEYASAMPVIMLGYWPWMHIEFDWTSNINASAASYLYIEAAGPTLASNVEQIRWRFRPGAGIRSGHAVIDLTPQTSLTNYVSLRLAVEMVPEPGTIVVLGVGLGWLMIRRRMVVSR